MVTCQPGGQPRHTRPLGGVPRGHGRSAKFQGVLLRALALGVTLASAALLVSCGYPGWTVFVMSDYESDVIVRITYDGGSRDVLVPAVQDVEQILSFSGPRPPARVDVLDANTCAVIASGDLPSRTVLVAFGDPFDGTKFGSMQVDPFDEPSDAELPPVDSRCAGF